MKLPFQDSSSLTLGLEWELALVDAQTGELRNVAEDILCAAGREFHGTAQQGEHPFIKQELLLNTIEVVSDVSNTVSEGIEHLRHTTRTVQRLAEPLGVKLYAQGSHPFAAPRHQPVTHKERYTELIERTQWWGRQMVIYGVHVHIGLDDVALAMPVVNTLCRYYPHFLALSASSPYWSGEDTAYASQRALMFQQLPTAGTSYQFQHWSEFERCVGDLAHTGVIDDVSEVRWDVRAVPRLGTVEMRICDGLATLEEIAAVAALTQCLAAETVELVRNGGQVEILQPWYVKENKWRAARYGTDAIVIVNSAGDEELVTETLAREIQRLKPLAQRLGCWDELQFLHQMMKQPGYRRQRQIAADHDQDLRAVVLDSVERTAASVQGPSPHLSMPL